MTIKPITYLTISVLMLVCSCQHTGAKQEADTTRIIEEVKIQVKAFHAADTALDAQGMVDLLWPEFTMLADGNQVSYADAAKGTKEFMASLSTFHSEWRNLKIIPLGSHHAISSFIFIDSIVAKDGTVTRSRGPNTFVWEKRNGEWKVIYGDADHYPVMP